MPWSCVRVGNSVVLNISWIAITWPNVTLCRRKIKRGVRLSAGVYNISESSARLHWHYLILGQVRSFIKPRWCGKDNAGTTKYPSTPFSIGWFQQSICWEISSLTLSNQLIFTRVCLHFSFLVQLDLQWLFHRSSRVCCGAMWSGYCVDYAVQPQLLTSPLICSPLSTSCAGWSPRNNRQMPVIGTLWEESILVVTCWMSSVQQLILKVSLHLARR